MKRLYILLSSVLLMNVCPAQAAFNSKKRPFEPMAAAVAAVARFDVGEASGDGTGGVGETSNMAAGASEADFDLDSLLGATGYDGLLSPKALEGFFEDEFLENTPGGAEETGNMAVAVAAGAPREDSDLEAEFENPGSNFLGDGGVELDGSDVDESSGDGTGGAEETSNMAVAVAARAVAIKGWTHVCKECGKKFKKKSHLDVHKVVHSDERPFACDYEGCGEDYKTSFHLNRHKLSHDKKPYKCDYEGCSESFKKISELNTHKRIHKKDENPYKCDYEGCGKAFKKTSELNTHKRIHKRDEKHYKCDYEGCGKAFNQKNDLKKHELTHSSERPFACDHPGCVAAFKQEDNLTRHKKEVHKKKLAKAAAGAGAAVDEDSGDGTGD